jgi:peptide/nickel transport system ATP-binding protein
MTSVLQSDNDMPGTDARSSVLRFDDVSKSFPLQSPKIFAPRPILRAVDNVSLDIRQGESFGLVGESGSGKSTLARIAVGLTSPTAGNVSISGTDVASASRRDRLSIRQSAQMVFQDPYSSFAPHSPMGESIAEPLLAHTKFSKTERTERVSSSLEKVGLRADFASRFPREMSGGQLQRAAIARALVLDPPLLVLDEPVSALDVSTQAQVINLLCDLRESSNITMFFIAHDLSVVRQASTAVGVMYLGRIIEHGPAESIYSSPSHPYTLALLSAVPIPDPTRQRTRERIILNGDIPSPIDPPSGCRFRTRCPFAMPVCTELAPAPFLTPAGSTVECHLHTTGPTLMGASVKELRNPGNYQSQS